MIMIKWIKRLAILCALYLVLGSALSVWSINRIETFEWFVEANPEKEVEYVASSLSYFDTLLTRDSKWTTVWIVDGEHQTRNWSRTYLQSFPMGYYFGLGSVFYELEGFVE
jgi:hypothetical protein